MDERSLRWAWLQECPNLGPAGLARIVARCGYELSDDFFGRPAEWYRSTFDLRPTACTALERHLHAPPRHLSTYAPLPLRAIVRCETAFPPRLTRMERPPTLIWTFGRHVLELSNGSLSVLSSTNQDVARTAEIKDACESAIRSGYALVAGHNRPVYQWALLAAKRSGSPFVMVLDRGLLTAFDDDLRRDPIPAARIWGYGFDADRGAALSSFRLRDPWIGAAARFRDTMVAALSDVVVAIGVREGGTMHRVCLGALARGQTVLADAGSLPFLSESGARPWTGELPEAGI